MDRRRFVLAATAVLIAAPIVSSATDAAPSADLEARIQNVRFEALASVREIPAAVLRLCYAPDTRIAEPGASFNSSDVGDSLPHLRLLWAVTDHTMYIFHVEVGGRSHYYRTIIASLSGAGAAELLWERAGNRLNGFEELKSTFRQTAAESGTSQ
jgi:hypothetical protein